MQKILFIFIIMTQVLLYANTKHVMLPDTQIQPLLKSINTHAITMGEGKKRVCVFLDPVCKYSRKFIKSVTQSPRMLKKYQYHIFFYEIPRFNSDKLIHYIYQSKEPLEELKKIMIEDNKPIIEGDFTKETKERVTSVKMIAQKLAIHKRPYIIISEYEKSEK